MSAIVWTLASVAIISIVSLVGALSLSTKAFNRHGVIMALVALAAGTLVGDTFLHLLPEAVAEAGSFTVRLSLLVIAGFLLFFVFEIALRWRHSHAALVDDPHGHAHHHVDKVQPFGWLNLASDAAHNLLDGAIIAAAYLADIRLGLITTIAVVAHEVPQELGDFAVLLRSGMRPARALLLNLATAFTSFFGALLVFWLPVDEHVIISVALPLIAGAFLYIAASDLVPELHHHSKGKDAVVILVAFVIGIGIMLMLLDLEAVLPLGDGHGHG